MRAACMPNNVPLGFSGMDVNNGQGYEVRALNKNSL